MTAKRTSLLVLGFGLLLLGLHAGDAVEGNDFGAYYAAGRAVLEGESIYTVASDEGRMYKYPPALAILIAPLSALPESVAAVIWVAAAVSLTFLSAFLCGRIAGHALGVKRTGLVAAASFLCVARPIDSDLGNGQANYLVLFFIALAVWSFVREQRFASGLALGTAAAFKVTPLLLCAYLVYKREWRAMGGVAASLVGLLLLLPTLVWGPMRAVEANVEWAQAEVAPYVERVREEAPEVTGAPRTVAGYSLRAAVHRLLTETVGSSHSRREIYVNLANLSPATADGIYRALAIALVGVSALVCGLARLPDRRRFVLEISIGVALMVAIAPVSRKAHFVSLMVPMSYLVATGVATGTRRPLLWLAPAWALLNLTGSGLIGRSASVRALAWGALAWGVLLLWGGLVGERVRERGRPTPAGSGEPVPEARLG